MSDKEDVKDDEESNSSIEKKRISVSLVGALIGVLGLFSILQCAAIIFLLSQSSTDPQTAANTKTLELLQTKVSQIQRVTESAEAYNQHAKVLEERLEQVLKETDLNNYTEVRALILHQEASYQAFIGALQKGMYDLSRMIKGSRTWYEVYKEDLDQVLVASQERLETLNEMAPEAEKAVQ